MPDPLPQSILCPILIGRDAQVAALARLLDQARAGHGQIALISGEAGIGKSRLVAETRKLPQRQRNSFSCASAPTVMKRWVSLT
jgi:predicted ATP-dependent serine protease